MQHEPNAILRAAKANSDYFIPTTYTLLADDVSLKCSSFLIRKMKFGFLRCTNQYRIWSSSNTLQTLLFKRLWLRMIEVWIWCPVTFLFKAIWSYIVCSNLQLSLKAYVDIDIVTVVNSFPKTQGFLELYKMHWWRRTSHSEQHHTQIARLNFICIFELL